MCALSFDGIQRYRILSEICSRLEVGPDTVVLDVGGGTGDLRKFLEVESVVSLDPRGGGSCHIRGSMVALPFPDESFELVVQADALEHLPGVDRETALGELVRVARGYVLWIGPVDNPLTIEAEEDLCEAHRRRLGGREMEWLSEHRRFGLPGAESVSETLAEGLSDWACWRCGSLRRWWTLMRMDIELEAGIYHPSLEESLDRWYNDSGWKSDFRMNDSTPAYRQAFIGCKRGRLPPDIDRPAEGVDSIKEWAKTLDLFERLERTLQPDAEGQATDPATSQQLEIIAEILRRQNAEENPSSFWERWLRGR